MHQVRKFRFKTRAKKEKGQVTTLGNMDINADEQDYENFMGQIRAKICDALRHIFSAFLTRF